MQSITFIIRMHPKEFENYLTESPRKKKISVYIAVALGISLEVTESFMNF